MHDSRIRAASLLRGLAVAACALALPACTSTGNHPGAVYDDDAVWEDYGDDGRYWSPERGVRCDRSEEICSDAWDEPDPGYTQRYFGPASASRLRSRLDQGWSYDGWGGGYGRGRLFSPSRGITCDRVRRLCFDGDGPSQRRTRDVFGERAARRLGERGREPSYIFQPAEQVTCDFRTEVCYGANRPNVAHTRRYFGEAAAARVRAELEDGLRDRTGQLFVPAAGVKCDRSVEVCYANDGTSVRQTQRYFGTDAAAKLRRESYCREDRCWRSERDAAAAGAIPSSLTPPAGPPEGAATETPAASRQRLQQERRASREAEHEAAARAEAERRAERLARQQAEQQAAAQRRAERLAEQQAAAAQRAAEQQAAAAQRAAELESRRAEQQAQQAARAQQLERIRAEREARAAAARAARQQRRADKRSPQDPDQEATSEP